MPHTTPRPHQESSPRHVHCFCCCCSCRCCNYYCCSAAPVSATAAAAASLLSSPRRWCYCCCCCYPNLAVTATAAAASRVFMGYMTNPLGFHGENWHFSNSLGFHRKTDKNGCSEHPVYRSLQSLEAGLLPQFYLSLLLKV